MSRPTRLIFSEPRKGSLGDLQAGFQPYADAGSTALATISLESFQSSFWFSNAEACNKIMQHVELFRKDTSGYDVISFHGPNIVASEGATWKRYRHAVRASFSEKSHALVWDECGHTLTEWFESLQENNGDIEVDVVHTLRKVTLNIMASAGFGQHFPWETSITDKPPPGLPFSTAIIDSVERILWRALTPGWARSLPVPQITKAVLAFDEMERHVEGVIREGRQTIKNKETQSSVASGSLLRGLLEANDDLEGESKLSDRELLSNIFVFLLAGHETSAHTLTFVTAIFALYPNIHARVREEADIVWPTPSARQASTYKSDFARLPYTLAVFYETLRHFPAEPVLPRILSQDTVLFGFKTNGAGDSKALDEEFGVMMPKGTIVVPDLYAMHMNPQYWGPTAPDFEPNRFLSTGWPKHAFAPFAGGPRACIGRGFATAESVRIIASIAQTWDVRCNEKMMRMPWNERKRVLLRRRQEVTMVPIDVNLLFSLRKQ